MESATTSRRWRLVMAYHKHKSFKGAARAEGVSVKTVKRWVQRVDATGGVAQRRGSGRPPIMTEGAAEKALQLLTSEDCAGAESVARELQTRGITSKKVHKTTVIRVAKALAEKKGMPIRAVMGQPEKELTAPTKSKRLSFAQSNKRKKWDSVMFTDRKRFLFAHPGAKVRPVSWIAKGSKRQAPRVNHPQCLNVYAGITMFGITKCHVVAGSSKHKTKYHNKKGGAAKNITAAEYEEVLKSTFLPEGERIFSRAGITSWELQQDNDPSHKGAAAIVAQWSKQRMGNVRVLKNWPPNSPDLSPIENLWSIVQSRVNAKGCKTFDEFRQAVLDEMNGVTKDELSHLYKSLERRMGLVIANDGGKTGY